MRRVKHRKSDDLGAVQCSASGVAGNIGRYKLIPLTRRAHASRVHQERPLWSQETNSTKVTLNLSTIPAYFYGSATVPIAPEAAPAKFTAAKDYVYSSAAGARNDFCAPTPVATPEAPKAKLANVQAVVGAKLATAKQNFLATVTAIMKGTKTGLNGVKTTAVNVGSAIYAKLPNVIEKTNALFGKLGLETWSNKSRINVFVKSKI